MPHSGSPDSYKTPRKALPTYQTVTFQYTHLTSRHYPENWLHRRQRLPASEQQLFKLKPTFESFIQVKGRLLNSSNDLLENILSEINFREQTTALKYNKKPYEMTLLFVVKVLAAWNNIIYNLWNILNDIDTSSKRFSRTTLVNNVCCKLYVEIWWYYYLTIFCFMFLFFFFFQVAVAVMVLLLMRSYFHSATKKVLDHLRAW